jgi:hypothetical protein
VGTASAEDYLEFLIQDLRKKLPEPGWVPGWKSRFRLDRCWKNGLCTRTLNIPRGSLRE